MDVAGVTFKVRRLEDLRDIFHQLLEELELLQGFSRLRVLFVGSVVTPMPTKIMDKGMSRQFLICLTTSSWSWTPSAEAFSNAFSMLSNAFSPSTLDGLSSAQLLGSQSSVFPSPSNSVTLRDVLGGARRPTEEHLLSWDAV